MSLVVRLAMARDIPRLMSLIPESARALSTTS